MCNTEKSCFKCGEIKPLSDFYKHSNMPDGRVNKCKECNKKDVRENREKRRDYYNAYDRNRNQTEHRRDAKLQSNSKPEVAQRIKAYKSTYKYCPIKRAATTAVNNAVRDNRLHKLPCWVCGNLDVEGHHPDYSAPLDVVWLCKEHHSEIHRQYDAEYNETVLESTEKGSRWK